MSKYDKSIGIDIGLSVLCATAKPGQTLSYVAIAEVCGCNQGYIQQVQMNALRKLKNRIRLLDHLEG